MRGSRSIASFVLPLVLCALLGVLASRRASAQPRLPPAETVQLQLTAPAGCGTVRGVSERVSRRSRQITITDVAQGTTRVDAQIERVGPGRVTVGLAIDRPGHAPSQRRLVAPDCAQAEDALALLIVLALDPASSSAAPSGRSSDAPERGAGATRGTGASRERGGPRGATASREHPPAGTVPPDAASAGARSSSPSRDDSPSVDANAGPDTPAERTADVQAKPVDSTGAAPDRSEARGAGLPEGRPPAAPQPDATAASPEPSDVTEPETPEAPMVISGSVGAAGFAHVGPAAGVLWGFGPTASLALDRAGVLSPELFVGAGRQWSGDLKQVGGTASFRLDAVFADLCPVRFRTSRLVVGACASILLADLRAEGSQTFDPRAGTSRFVAVGGGGRLGVGLTSRLRAQVGVDVAHPLTRDSFEFSPAVFHQVPAVTTRLDLGLALIYP